MSLRAGTGWSLTGRESRLHRELEHTLNTLDIATCALPLVRDALGKLLGVAHMQAHSFEDHEGRVRLAFMHTDKGPQIRLDMDSILAAHGPERFSAFDLLAPERAQRNRALTWAPEVTAELGARHVLERHGLGGTYQLRALICDGASLLAWVGGYSDTAVPTRTVRIFETLIPTLRRRLLLERDLGVGSFAWRALDAALEALGAAAYIVSSSGHTLHANRAGRERLRDRAMVVRLSEAVRGDDPEFALQPLRSDGPPTELLVIERTSATALRCKVATARWSLTPRQSEILALVASGCSNATIAAELRISVRTVEVHITALFDRAGCESRSGLVAQLLAL